MKVKIVKQPKTSKNTIQNSPIGSINDPPSHTNATLDIGNNTI